MLHSPLVGEGRWGGTVLAGNVPKAERGSHRVPAWQYDFTQYAGNLPAMARRVRGETYSEVWLCSELDGTGDVVQYVVTGQVRP